LQIATRESAVLPNATAVLGAAQRAAESTKPRESVDGSAAAGGVAIANTAQHAAAATMLSREQRR
jgi:hypothetical protein